MIAAIVLFLGGIGARFIPMPELWGLFCVAIGLLLDEYDLGFDAAVKLPRRCRSD